MGGLAACLLAGGLITPAAADSAGDLKAAQDKQAQLEAIRHQLGDNIAGALAAQEQLKQALEENRRQRDKLSTEIAVARVRLAELDTELKVLSDDIAATRRRIGIQQAQLRSMARAIYVQPESVLVGLAESSSAADFMTKLGDLTSAGDRAKGIKERLEAEERRLRADEARVRAIRDEQQQLHDRLLATLAKLRELQAQQETAQRDLELKIAQTRNELERVNKQSADQARAVTELLQRQQDEIIANAMQSVWDAVQAGAAPGPFTASPGHSQKYRFVWPLPTSQVTQRFGPSDLPFEPPYLGYPHFHTGLDLASPLGAAVLSPDDGVVVLVGSGTTGYGNFVVLAHSGGLDTLYGHLQQALVKLGDPVQQGQPIGLEGSTGNSTGPHLHFETRIAGKMVDPALYLPPGAPSPLKL